MLPEGCKTYKACMEQGWRWEKVSHIGIVINTVTTGAGLAVGEPDDAHNLEGGELQGKWRLPEDERRDNFFFNT